MDEETEGRACEVEELKRLREDIYFYLAHRKMKWWEMKEDEKENVPCIWRRLFAVSLLSGPKINITLTHTHTLKK